MQEEALSPRLARAPWAGRRAAKAALQRNAALWRCRRFFVFAEWSGCRDGEMLAATQAPATAFHGFVSGAFFMTHSRGGCTGPALGTSERMGFRFEGTEMG